MARSRKTLQKKKMAAAPKLAPRVITTSTGPISPGVPTPGGQNITDDPFAASGTYSLPSGGMVASVRLVIGADVSFGTIDTTVTAGNWRATFPGVTIPANTPMALIVTASTPDGTRDLIIPFQHVPPPTNSGVTVSHTNGSTVSGTVTIDGTITGASKVEVLIDGSPTDITGNFHVTTDFGGADGDHTIQILGTSSAHDPDPAPPSFHFTVDASMPSVASITQIGSTLILVFSEDMSDSAFDSANYTLTAPDSSEIGVTASRLGDQTAQLDLDEDLTSGDTYSLTLSNITDVAGNALSNPDQAFQAT